MNNPFKPAKSSSKHQKILLWGASGTGKTTISLQFPSPVMIDLEKGAELYGDKFDFDVINATTLDQIREAIAFLNSGKHEYKTLIIDPITVVWEMLQSEWSDKLFNHNKCSKGFKNEYYEFQMKDWALIKKEWKDLVLDIIALNMTIVATAREKILMDKAMKITGLAPDAEKNIEYYFDIVGRLTNVNNERKTTIVKDRTTKLQPVFNTCINNFIDGGLENEEKGLTPIGGIKEHIGIAEKHGATSFYHTEHSNYKKIAVEETAVELGRFNLFGFDYPYEDLARDLIMIKQRDGKWIGSRQYLHKLQEWEKLAPEVREKINYVLEITK